jgi:hypothetical protein
MVEFIVGIVVVLALFVGMIQLASLTRAQTDTMVNARRAAAEQAMMDPAMLSYPDYIEAISVGDDGSSYSADDEPAIGDPAAFTAVTVDRSADGPAAWALIDAVPDNQFSALKSSASMVDLQLVSGSDSATVAVLPGVQHLLYDADTITVESRVWMPWLRGIY